jgi:hypothetical protein
VTKLAVRETEPVSTVRKDGYMLCLHRSLCYAIKPYEDHGRSQTDNTHRSGDRYLSGEQGCT